MDSGVLPARYSRNSLAHVALIKRTGILRVANLRLLRLAANDNSAVFIEANNRRSRVLNKMAISGIPSSLTRAFWQSICRSQVDPIFVTHAIVRASLCDSVFVVASSDVIALRRHSGTQLPAQVGKSTLGSTKRFRP